MCVSAPKAEVNSFWVDAIKSPFFMLSVHINKKKPLQHDYKSFRK